jgi:hypothetical protein
VLHSTVEYLYKKYLSTGNHDTNYHLPLVQPNSNDIQPTVTTTGLTIALPPRRYLITLQKKPEDKIPNEDLQILKTICINNLK